MKVELKSITPNAELNIVEIARVSSSRKDKTEKPEGLINYLIKNNHWSPLEHSFITFEIETSKAIGIQLLRHRSFTFQEFSQRYATVEELELFELRKQAETNRQSSTEVFNPNIEMREIGKDWDTTTSAHELIYEYLEYGKTLYKNLLEVGVARECARMILPMCTQTTIFMTGSIRSWLGFLNIRLDNHSQKEIVEISKEIGKIIQIELPLITKATNNFNKFQGMFM